MTFLIILICSIIACIALRNPIRRYPVLFYAIAIAIDVVYIYGVIFGMPRAIWMPFYLLIQKCTVSLALFIVVMYIGVFSRTSKFSTWLRPIRGELSIIAWFLALGHVTVYLVSYLPRIFSGMKINVLISFCVALVILALLMVLGITSFKFVRKRMKTTTWTKIQKWAYVFFMLTYVHLLFILLPSALAGGTAATLTVCVYSVIFITYAILRIIRAQRDHDELKTSSGEAR